MCGMCDITDFVRTFYDNTTAERYGGGFNENQDIEGTGLAEFMDKYREASAWVPDITAPAPWADRHVEIDAAVTAGARHAGRSQHGDPSMAPGGKHLTCGIP